MAKGSGGTRTVGPGKKGEGQESTPRVLIPGVNDPELTDAIKDYYLPAGVRGKINEIKELDTFSKLQDYFAERGIELRTDNEKLNGELKDTYLKYVAETGQKLAAAVETYRELFGKNALSKLKTITLGDATLQNKASFHYNEPGENDPYAGTLRIKGFDASGYVVFHELAHAFQYSKTKKGESLKAAADRLIKKGKLDASVKAYSGANTSAAGIDAERMADAMGHGFAQGSKKGLAFINGLIKAYKRK